MSAALVRASPAPSDANSTLTVSYRFKERSLPASRRSPFGFLARAEEADKDAPPAGIRSLRVLVDRDLVPGWFLNPAYGVCTPAKVKGAYGLTQMERACGGSRLGGGFLARVRFADGHTERFGAELFGARFFGQRGLVLHLDRLGYPVDVGGPSINIWGPVYRVLRKPFRWGYHLVVPRLQRRHDALQGAVITRLTTDFDPDPRAHGAWLGRCDDRRLVFEGRIAIRGQSSPDVRRIAKRCVPTSG